MEYQLLKPEVISKLLDIRLCKIETNQFAGEAQELEDDKPDEKKNASKPKKCYLLVTEICFYYVTKESLRIGKPKEIISLFDICDITLGQNDFITLKFKKKTFYFMLANSAALMTNILLQVKKLAWNITPGQIFSFKVIIQGLSCVIHIQPIASSSVFKCSIASIKGNFIFKICILLYIIICIYLFLTNIH